MIEGIRVLWFKATGIPVIRFFLLISCLNPYFLAAQNYPSRHFTMRDGLPSMAIRCIYKDTRGLLWLGTDAGLCSFDGKSFHIFKSSEGMTASQVWAIAEDEQGNLWFGSHGEGLYKYNGKKFTRFTQKDGMADDRIRVLCYSKNFHCLIAGGYNGISTIREKSITGSPGILYPKNMIFSCVTGIMDAGKFIYITTYSHSSPIRYYPDQNKYVSVHDSGVYYPSHSFSAYLTSKGDTIFSLTTKGACIFKKDGVIKNDTIGQIFGIAEDKRGDLWFAGWSVPGMNLKGGVFRFDGKTFRNYKTPFGISDGEVWSVFCDHEQDILWVGTLNEGLFRIPSTVITTYPPSYFNLQHQKINNLFIDSKNVLWISGNRELIKMAPDGSFTYVDKHKMILSYRKLWNTSKPRPFNKLLSDEREAQKLRSKLLPEFEKRMEFDFHTVNEDKDHNFLFYTRLGNFYIDEKNKITEYMGVNDALAEQAITGRDTLIFAGWGWTYLLPKYRVLPDKKYNFMGFDSPLYLNFSKERNPKDVNRVVSHGNRSWYTSWASGMWMSHGMNLVNFNKSDSTISNDLNDVCFDKQDHVIFGSNTGEICIATYENSKLKIIYRINSDNGIQGNTISWLLADRNGKLWAGTNKGLNCIDLEQLYRSGKYVIRFMDEEDGYVGQSSKKGVMDQDGNLWIGTEDLLIRLNTKSFDSSDSISCKIILKSLEINGASADSILEKELNRQAVFPSGHFNLKYSESNLVFFYDILNYNNPAKERFRYMLKGYDETWSHWGTGRKAVYTNLPSGEYTFCVEAGNLRSLAHFEPLEVKFTIRHPWWGLWYVQVLVILLVVMSGIAIMKKYLEIDRNREHRKSEIEKKIVQLEMQALQAQMNPHFIFNCVNGIQYYVLANKMDEVLSYLSDFSKVVRESLGNATLRVILLKQEISFLHSYLRLEQMRFPDKFDYIIDCQKFDKGESILIPPMLVQPFAENAVRHGFGPIEWKGHLSIIFKKEGEAMVKCTITDNGIGRERALLNSVFSPINDRPHSTLITATRLRLFNPPGTSARYQIIYTDLSENGNTTGLRVELYMPMEIPNGKET